MKKIPCLIILSHLWFYAPCQDVTELSKSITFIYTENKQGFHPVCSAVAISDDPGGRVFIATTRHCIRDLNTISFRFNTKDSIFWYRIPLHWDGTNKNIYIHSDTSVDLAIIPIVMPSNVMYESIPINQFIKRSELKSANIKAGTEIYFTGLFTADQDKKQNKPIFKSGRLQSISNKRIEGRDLFLIESSNFGRNIGSPVFLKYSYGTVTKSSLAGIIFGPVKNPGILKEDINKNSLELSAVIPAEYLTDILKSSELLKREK